MGGGGGNTTTQVSGVPEWLRPDVQRAFGSATQAHQAGDLERIAGETPETQEALAVQQGLGRDAIAGTGAFDTTGAVQRDLQNLAGQQLAGQSGTGTLSSARGSRAREAALADRSLQHAQQRQQAQAQGAQALAGVGQQRQQRAQALADRPHTGLQRLFGYYGSGAAGQQTKQSGGGGK